MTSSGARDDSRRAESERLHAAVLHAAGRHAAGLRDVARGGLTGKRFEELALDVARFQASHRARSGVESPRAFSHIAPVPTDVFRVVRVAVHPPEEDTHVFRTSGTTGSQSGHHPFRDTRTMEELSVRFGGEMLLGRGSDVEQGARWTVANLAPAPGSEPYSSLGFMLAAFARHFDGRSWAADGSERVGSAAEENAVRSANHPQNGFEDGARWLVTSAGVDASRLRLAVDVAERRGEPLLLSGTSFAFVQLLDLLGVDGRLPLPPRSRLMTTGGTKGRVRETTSRELRHQLSAAFQVPLQHILAEYGMTELSSQLYARPEPDGSDGVFVAPPWLRVEALDPIAYQPVPDGTPGLACFTDLANVDSVVRVLTQDLVTLERGGVKLHGRSPGGSLRGCSLRFDTAAPVKSVSEKSSTPGSGGVARSGVTDAPRRVPAVPRSRAARSEAEVRVRQLLDAARRIAEPTTELGSRARQAFVTSTGLSAAGVDYALGSCLETEATDEQIAALLGSVESYPRAHVVLSSTVFTAALRAIAVALAASARVVVKPSRREGELVRLLVEAAPGLFDLTDTLDAEPGDAVWAYGSDSSLAEISRGLSPDVHFFPHGSGMGLAAVRAQSDLAEAARLLALDTLAFDQRGCLSPRIVAFDGTLAEAARFAERVAAALTDAGRRIPLGHRTREEFAELAWYRTTLDWVGSGVRVDLLPGPGNEIRSNRVHPSLFPIVGSSEDELLVPPAGRNLHVVAVPAARVLESLRPFITCVGCGDAELVRELTPHAGGIRVVRLGMMQRPPLDGVVDRRR